MCVPNENFTDLLEFCYHKEGIGTTEGKDNHWQHWWSFQHLIDEKIYQSINCFCLIFLNSMINLLQLLFLI